MRTLERLGPSKDDELLLQQPTKDFESGFCSPPLTKDALLKQLKGRPCRLIPRCVITQSSGKQRIIDNADAGDQSETSDSNKLVLCSALRPEDLCAAKESDSLESGGEDWPDAYRHCPMNEDESLACLVVWWHHGWNAPAFQIYAGLLFGLPLAVTSFNTYSRFAEASSSRVAWTVASSYFDDFNIVDWSSSKGSGPWAVGAINGLLGTAFADEKRQAMSSKGTFLGLDHDLSCALSEGYVTFWARDRLFSKMEDLIRQAEGSNTLIRSGLASKMFGLMNFLEQGMYGRVGCGGLAALCDRQGSRETVITDELRDCFHLIRAILQLRPERRYWICQPPVWQHPRGQLREGFVAADPGFVCACLKTRLFQIQTRCLVYR